MKSILSALLATGLLFLAGCGEKKTNEDSGEAGGGVREAAYPATEAGVKALASALIKDFDFLKSLQPSREECGKIGATATDAEAIDTYASGLFASLETNPVTPKAEQSEILVLSATTEGLKAGSDRDLAGGYTMTAKHYRDGLRIYAFKYVEPGKDSGLRFDGLIHLDGRWVLVPKLWRAFPGS